jgi:Zinc binding domain
MSECCTSNVSEASSRQPGHKASCPICGTKAKPISTRAVKSLVRDHTRVSAERVYWLCRAPGCDVVYFSEAESFCKREVKVRVGFKEQQDPIPLCYCFDYTRSDISRDLALRGETDIPDRVKAEIQRGYCACEVKNPSGTCCLGDITRAIHAAKKHAKETLSASP